VSWVVAALGLIVLVWYLLARRKGGRR
jgi:hypothetical protein